MKKNNDLILGFEIDLLPAVSLEIAHKQKIVSEYMRHLIANVKENKRYLSVKKRSWLSKNELFVHDPETGRIIGFSQDNENIEVATLPFILNRYNVKTIVCELYQSLIFADKIFNDLDIPSDKILLPVSGLYERMTGWHLNLSHSLFVGREDLLKVFERVLPIFSMTINRNFMQFRSLRVKYISDKRFEISSEKPFVPLSLPDRQFQRRNNVNISIPTMDFPDMIHIDRLLHLLLLLTEFITDEANYNKLTSGILKHTDRQYCSLVKKINKGGDIACLIEIFESSFSYEICTLLKLDVFKKPFDVDVTTDYFNRMTLFSYLERNRAFIKKNKYCQYDDIIKSDFINPLRYFFNNYEIFRDLVHDLDWEICSIKNKKNEIFRVPLKYLADCNFDTEKYMVEILNRYSNEFSSLFNIKCDFKSNLHRILDGVSLEFDLNESFDLYPDDFIKVIWFLSWLSDTNKLPGSSVYPFAISEDQFIKNEIPILIPEILGSHRFLFLSIYVDKFKEVNFLKIIGPERILNLFKKNKRFPFKFDYQISRSAQGKILLYESDGLCNASSLFALQQIYFKYREDEANRFIIDRGFIIALINEIRDEFR